jgi:hypothetical protein
MGSSADSLAARMDALADALRAAGVAPDRTARILGSAAEAAMHALVLDAVLDESAAQASAVEPAAQAAAPDERPMKLAA